MVTGNWRACTRRPVDRNVHHRVTVPQHWHIWRGAATGSRRVHVRGRSFTSAPCKATARARLEDVGGRRVTEWRQATAPRQAGSTDATRPGPQHPATRESPYRACEGL